jgi:hypothetical protein
MVVICIYNICMIIYIGMHVQLYTRTVAGVQGCRKGARCPLKHDGDADSLARAPYISRWTDVDGVMRALPFFVRRFCFFSDEMG